MTRPTLAIRDAWPLLVAVIYVAYGVYLLAVGSVLTIVTPEGGSTTVREPSSAGLIPIATGLIVLFGIWSGRDRIAWAGGAFAVLAGVAFLFSLSPVLIPLALLLVAGLAVRGQLGRRESSPR